MTVTEYLKKAKSLADELESARRALSASEFNAIIYPNIGAEYHSIISSLNLHPQPITFSELHGELVAQEILLQS